MCAVVKKQYIYYTFLLAFDVEPLDEYPVTALETDDASSTMDMEPSLSDRGASRSALSGTWQGTECSFSLVYK